MSSICEEDIAQSERDHLDNNMIYHHNNNNNHNNNDNYKDLNNSIINYNHSDITDCLINEDRYQNLDYSNDCKESYNNANILNNKSQNNNDNFNNDNNKYNNNNNNNYNNNNNNNYNNNNNMNNYNLKTSLYNYRRNCIENNDRKSLFATSHPITNLNNPVSVNSSWERSVSPTVVSSLCGAHVAGSYVFFFFFLSRDLADIQ